MSYADTARVSAQLVHKLDEEWGFAGEVNKMRAYHRPGQAVCILEWEDSWRIFAGASTKAGLEGIAESLEVELEGWAV